MMRSTYLLVLIGAAMLAGCSIAPKQDPTTVAVEPLIEAQHALARGNLRQAEAYLGSAPSRLEDNDTRSQVRVLLLAELALRRGENANATRLAEMARSVNADNPQATELLGKVALLQGRFTEAAHLFESSRIFYMQENDRQRASDLLRLTNGLAAYGEGDVPEARRNWSRIQSPALRAQFERTYASIVGAESN